MIDAAGQLEVFLITNGRSSLNWAVKSIEAQQGIDFKFSIVRDMEWIDACNHCLAASESRFYARIDDDMFLHPLAISYFYELSLSCQEDRVSALVCKLWEPATKRIISSVKAYHTEHTRKIGFRTDDRGKIDQIFREDMKVHGLEYQGDKGSSLGVHAACPLSENMVYIKNRNEHTSKHWAEKNKILSAHDVYFQKYGYKHQFRIRKDQLVQKNGNSGFACHVKANS